MPKSEPLLAVRERAAGPLLSAGAPEVVSGLFGRVAEAAVKAGKDIVEPDPSTWYGSVLPIAREPSGERRFGAPLFVQDMYAGFTAPRRALTGELQPDLMPAEAMKTAGLIAPGTLRNYAAARDAYSFVKSPNGNIDWGIISDEAARGSGGALKELPIRVSDGVAGKDGFGYAHVDSQKAARIKKLGFQSTDEFLDHVSNNFNLALELPNGRIGLVVSPGRGTLKKGEAAHNLMVVEMRDEGDHYGVTTAIPNALESYLKSGAKKELWRRTAYPQTGRKTDSP